MKRLLVLLVIAVVLSGCIYVTVNDIWQIKVNSHSWEGQSEREGYAWYKVNVTITSQKKDQRITNEVGTFYIGDGDSMYSWNPNSNVIGRYSKGQSRSGELWFEIPEDMEPTELFFQQEGMGSMTIPL
jgi:opacity protein-like surface antigen